VGEVYQCRAVDEWIVIRASPALSPALLLAYKKAPVGASSTLKATRAPCKHADALNTHPGALGRAYAFSDSNPVPGTRDADAYFANFLFAVAE